MSPEEFIKDYTAALESQNWNNVEPLIHQNACVTFSNGTVHKGIHSIKEAYTRNFSLIKNEEYLVSDVHWVIKNKEIAVYLFNFSWKGIIKGQQSSGSGRGSATLLSENGRWKLIAEHLGPDK